MIHSIEIVIIRFGCLKMIRFDRDQNFSLLIPGLEKRVLRMNKRVFLCTFLRRPLPNNVFATNLPQSQSLISLKTNSPSTMKIQVPDKTRRLYFDLF